MNLYAINFIFFKNSEFKVYCFSSLKYTTKYDKVGEHYQWLLGKWEEERKEHQGTDLLTQLTAQESKILELGLQCIRAKSS